MMDERVAVYSQSENIYSTNLVVAKDSQTAAAQKEYTRVSEIGGY
jgi:hypothetical protein